MQRRSEEALQGIRPFQKTESEAGETGDGGRWGCRGQIRNHIAGELESGWEGSPQISGHGGTPAGI